MAVSRLTTEQKNMLQESPHVARVTDTTVAFTQKFKRYFCEEYINGKKPRQILAESGIDATILGDTRLNSLRWHTLQEFQDNNGEVPEDRIRKTKLSSANTTEGKLELLEQELLYTKQELEFLKKLLSPTKKPENAKNRSNGCGKIRNHLWNSKQTG